MNLSPDTDFRGAVYRDVVGEGSDEESAMLRTDQNVRKWYAQLKVLRQQKEHEHAEAKKAAKHTHRKAPLHDRADELGLEISWVNATLSEARDLVKDLNIRETAAKAKRVKVASSPTPSVTIPPAETVVITDDAQLRGDLRAAQRMMRRCFDFLVLDSNITFIAMDNRDALVADLRRELRGT
jgi:hypothetical protein